MALPVFNHQDCRQAEGILVEYEIILIVDKDVTRQVLVQMNHHLVPGVVRSHGPGYGEGETPAMPGVRARSCCCPRARISKLYMHVVRLNHVQLKEFKLNLGG